MNKLFLTGTLCLFGVSTFAANGLVVSMKTTHGAATETSQIQLDANHMRAEMAGRAGGKSTVVFDGVKQTMYIIDDSKKTYNEITKDDMDRMAGQLAQMRGAMQGAMANMPPDQRAKMEAQMQAMMRGRGMSAPAKPTFKKTGTDTVGKWTCDKYEGYEGDKKTSEVCTVDPKALGLTESDFDVQKQFQKFFSTLMPNQSMPTFTLASLEDRGYAGVAIRTINYAADGSVSGTSELTDISHQNLPDSTFAPPSGYTKQAMGFGRGGGL